MDEIEKPIPRPPGETVEQQLRRLYRENQIMGDFFSNMANTLGCSSSLEGMNKKIMEICERATFADKQPSEKGSVMFLKRIALAIDARTYSFDLMLDQRLVDCVKDLMDEVRRLRNQTAWRPRP
jgi:hypothetical protein